VKRRWSGAAADGAHAPPRDLPIDLVDERTDLLRAWELLRTSALHDLLYVALAERRRAQLVTADMALRRQPNRLDRRAGRAPPYLTRSRRQART
jgi:predicted nucleic acid-binding protein